jgi:hypothetical protein
MRARLIARPAGPHAEVTWGSHWQRESTLPTIEQTIADKFLTKLADGEEVDASKIEQLRTLLADNKKPQPDDFVKMFSIPVGGNLK